MRTSSGWHDARGCGRVPWFAVGFAVGLAMACGRGKPPGAPPTDAPSAVAGAAWIDAGSGAAAVAQTGRAAAATMPSVAAAGPMEAWAARAGAPATPPPLDFVASHGIRGRLVANEFLSDAGDGRRHLIAVDWEIPAGKEQYLCARVTVPEDVYSSGHYPIDPPGTHHTALTVLDKPNAPDGVTECDISEVGTQNLGGSGVGTTGGPLPDGIAMKYPRGSQILLNVHLLNATEGPLRGRSGADITRTTADKVTHLADGVVAGPLKLSIPPGRSVQSGVCTVDHDYTVFGIIPHMHETGVHMRVVAHRAAGDVVLSDRAFDFYDQQSYPLEPLALKTGDTVTVECTYENASGRTLHFGESSHDEMCVAGLARYPAGGKSACPY